MGGRWRPIRFQFLIFSLIIQGSLSLNHEGLALLEFRARIDWDPHGSVARWNPLDSDPCMWDGVHCVDGKVQMLDLSELSLKGSLASELGKLHHLRSLLLYKNRFSGTIPKEFGDLKELELLDLRDNDLGGSIPGEMGSMLSLKRLLLCQNKFEGSVPSNLGRPGMLSELQFDMNLICSAENGICRMNRKLGHCTCHGSLIRLDKAESMLIPIKDAISRYINMLHTTLFKLLKGSLAQHKDCADEPSAEHIVQNARNIARIVRRRLLEQTQNLPAAPASGGSDDKIIALPITRGSGSFPAVPKDATKQSPPQSSPQSLPTPPHDPPAQASSSGQSSGAKQEPSSSQNLWKYLIIIPCVVVLIAVLVMIFVCCKRGKVIGPWKTGISGQLQKAFITGVPKLNRSELETACEDFSNIVNTVDGCTIYKGTLSSGIEIAVASTCIASSKDWSNNLEIAYRRMIDTLSRINHKNFVNLIGFCEEEEPFSRMMVFEYAPNGSLYEHLHVKEMEHLDWTTRMRVIMGIAYCLQYMHHDLNPPVAHTHLTSTCVLLTDDYAPKVAELAFGPHSTTEKAKISGDDNESENSITELPPNADPETNIYSFGVLLLEIISGKLPYTEEDGPIEKWASKYLNEEKNVIYMVDPSLKSFKNEELFIICDIVRDCIQSELRHRPTMRDIITKLRQVISISPDQATPKLSPLWWAELEILSVEAT